MNRFIAILICMTLVGCASSSKLFDMSNHERIDYLRGYLAYEESEKDSIDPHLTDGVTIFLL